jgi:hypothetical protein
MTAFDIIGVVTGVIGVCTVLVSLCRWLSPRRRLRALDVAMQRAKDLLDTILTQEDGLLAYSAIDGVQEAHEWAMRTGFRVASAECKALGRASPLHGCVSECRARALFSGPSR